VPNKVHFSLISRGIDKNKIKILK
jgi:hypothetical protein